MASRRFPVRRKICPCRIAANAGMKPRIVPYTNEQYIIIGKNRIPSKIVTICRDLFIPNPAQISASSQ